MLPDCSKTNYERNGIHQNNAGAVRYVHRKIFLTNVLQKNRKTGKPAWKKIPRLHKHFYIKCRNYSRQHDKKNSVRLPQNIFKYCVHKMFKSPKVSITLFYRNSKKKCMFFLEHSCLPYLPTCRQVRQASWKPASTTSVTLILLDCLLQSAVD